MTGPALRHDPMALTARESEVLDLMCHAITSTRAISERLGITEKTVKTHRSNIYAKLGAVSAAQAVVIAVKRRLVQL